MRYIYYPGCSLEGSAREYDRSTRAFLAAMGVDLVEIEDWTCCGASAAEAASRYLSLALPARNLALAERIPDIDDLLVPCSACYLNLKKVEEKIRQEPSTRQIVNTILAEDGLQVHGGKRTRHLLDVVARDLGAAALARRVTHPLDGLRIAPYYGCQCLRPYPAFDDPEAPRSMAPLLEATGAAVHSWDMGGKCCGASHMNTKMAVGLELVASILRRAVGADAVVTVCPMCQMNLEGYQRKVSRLVGEDLSISVLYLPQLLGLALGLSAKDVGVDLNLSVYRNFREKLQRLAAAAAYQPVDKPVSGRPPQPNAATGT